MENYELLPGTLLCGRYRIESVHGCGGFGVTYIARDTALGGRAAVKELYWRGHCRRDESHAVQLLSGEDAAAYADVRAGFQKEADILKALCGLPGVVQFREYFEANNTAYIVMDCAEGQTLATLIAGEDWKKKRPGARKLCRQFLPLMESVGRIHERGYIHRDISPENIIVSPEGKMTLIDFGSAGTYQREDGARFTTIAKDGYAPGEQYREGAKQGPWSDVYALCATLYACLTGNPPESARARSMLDELRPPSSLGVKTPRALEAVIMRGLAMDSVRRYADMEELTAAIRRALRQTAIRRLRTGALGVLLALAIGVAGWQVQALVTDDTSPAGNRIQATWENTMFLSAAGENQVRAFALEGETNAYLYDFYNMENATQGERDDLVRGLKRRLDALGVPYAFGAEEGEEGRIAVRLAPQRLSDFVLATLAHNFLYVTGESDADEVTLSYSTYQGRSGLSVVQSDEGIYALRCQIGDDFGYEALIAGMQARGEDTLYLRDDRGNAIAQAALSQVQDGAVDFAQFRFEGLSQITEENRWLVDYVDAVLNTPALPLTGTLAQSEALDGKGAALADTAPQCGMRVSRTKGEQALVNLLVKIREDTGYSCYESADGSVLFVNIGLPVDDSLPQRAAQVTEQLLSSYPLSGQTYNKTVLLRLIDEQENERCRIALNRRISLDDTPGEENEISVLLLASERLEPYMGALNAWRQGLPDVYHGFSVYQERSDEFGQGRQTDF